MHDNTDKEQQLKASAELKEFLKQRPLPWLWYDEAKEKLILVVDNHLLSTYRACPQHFLFAHVLGLKRKDHGGASRNWYLEFGVLLHRRLEVYYKHFRESSFDVQKWAVGETTAAWQDMQMDFHSEHKEYKSIGGLAGLVGLLMQYSTAMSAQNEKLRVLGTEVSFGKNCEVPLWSDCFQEYYLSGRMDVIVDDGYFICPMDHKTMGSFRGDPGLKFETDEGPTGYIYALKTVLPQFVPEEQILKRDCSKILMNLISKQLTTNLPERFKRVPIRKTTEQLEQYRLRMAATCESLLWDMNRIAFNFPIPRNTQVCQNWMHFQCSYFDLCRQASKQGYEATLNNGFVQVQLWDTETVETAS